MFSFFLFLETCHHSYGNLEIVSLFIEEYGADVNIKHEQGWTPLHFACR